MAYVNFRLLDISYNYSMFQFCFIFPLIQIQMLLLSLLFVLGTNGTNPKNVLMVTLNDYASHFALTQKLAEALVAQHWVGHVHLLIIEDDIWNRDYSLVSGPKLTLQYFNPNEIKQREKPQPSQPVFSKWSPRSYTSRTHMVPPPGSLYEENQISEFAREKEEVLALQAKRFDIGIAEALDYAAFPLFRLIGVRHMVATLSMPIPSIFYEIMDSQYLQRIIDQGDIPELWTAVCDDHLRNYSFSARIFGQLHMENVKSANKRYAEADIRFGKIYDAYRKNDLENDLENEKKRKGKKSKGIKLKGTKSKVKILSKGRKRRPRAADEPIPEYRPLRELFRECAHFFVNTQPFVDFPMPPGMPQKFAFIGGITLAANNAVSEKGEHLDSSSESESWLNDIVLQEHLAQKKDASGLILVSFGTIVPFEKMPYIELYAMLLTFSKEFPTYTFIVKSAEDLRGYYGGKIVSKQWLPQKEMLASGHIKLFISHCGMNSVLEAAHNGVPLLCVPFFADQYYNAEAMAKRGAAVVFNREGMSMQILDVTKKAFSLKLHEALKDSYKDGMEAIQNELAKTKPMEEFLERMSGLN